jgi:hypothetical protein
MAQRKSRVAHYPTSTQGLSVPIGSLQSIGRGSAIISYELICGGPARVIESSKRDSTRQ